MLNSPAPHVAIARSRFVSRSPVYYGWVILVVGSLGLVMTSPGQTYAVSIFIEHFIQDLGISRSLVSTLFTLGTLGGSLALPLVGRQVDRWGSRWMVVAIAALFGLACLYMGTVANALMLGIGFFAVRMLGQGALSLVSQNVINQWWVRRRGLVMGISGLAVSLLGLGAFPSLINGLIPLYGWRATYTILGGILLLAMTPLGLLFFRDHPEKYGLRPDGDGVAGEAAAPLGPVAEESWTLAEAAATPAYWILAIGLASLSMLSTGLFFHMVSILADANLPPELAATVFLPIAATTAAVNFVSGILVDRVPVRLLLAAALVLQALALWMAPHLHGAALALAYGTVLGMTGGLMRTVNSVVWAKYYGRRHLGAISGSTSTMLIVGSALGPMPMGIARDLLGSYTVTLSVAALLPLLLGVGALCISRPVRSRAITG